MKLLGIFKYKQDSKYFFFETLFIDTPYHVKKNFFAKRIYTKNTFEFSTATSFIKTLLSYQSSIKADVNSVSKDFEEIVEKQKSIQQEIYEKYLEKIKLKNQMDKAILKYTKCIEQYNNLCSIERDILIQKQQKEQQLIVMNQIHVFDNKVLKGFNVLNSKLQKLIEENQEFKKKWNKWNSQEIAIFIGHTLKCKKSKMNQYNEIIKKNRIDGISLSKLSKTDLMSIFDFETSSQACNIYNSFDQIFIDSDEGVPQQDIPKEYICPLSNSIMKDPVIALNGITYDQSSIMNQYQNIPNYSSLMTDGNLELYPDISLQQKIKHFLKSLK
ncbi:hypothetical protein RFI_36614 [Reticulomyxa filosa]|uniref:U-box domain-containing protein n=1 Tax=Reticulomyxa filosa TaxID=46433 RepID=X6LI61_RETFI|nr:hypothetical protein RFI_36614 [Reticulomyxa filosa]|eukprot:ETO00827.1 hypothetical protein RFI_36614 [Reticulomyxa filosa]